MRHPVGYGQNLIDLRLILRRDKPDIGVSEDIGKLFQGQERGGQIQGEAFVFKAGCAPAGYRVTGRRTDGVLVLAGAAPHRGRGCEIISESTGSKHANLVFNYDPLLNSPDVGSAMSGPQVVTRAK